jgi:hypothetical protein
MRLLAVVLMTASLLAVVSAQNTPGLEGAVAPERRLTLPVLRANQPCPASIGLANRVLQTPHIFGGPWWFGDGPIYVDFPYGHGDRASFSLTSVPAERGVHRVKTPWVADPSYSGPVEIRGRSLGADRQVLLFSSSMFETPADRLRLQAPNPASTGEWSFWPSGMFVPGPGCYGIQIDTARRTQIVAFEAR